MNIKFIPLSFINSDNEILKQIKNTVLISFLFKQYDETTLEFYLDTTQYGYTASALQSGKHKLVRITDINDGNVNWKTVPFCDCDTESKYLLKDNDILVARTGGTTGKSFIVKNPPTNAVFASYLIRLRLNKKTDLEFINYFLNSYAFWSQIIEMKAGSAMPNVNAEKLKTLKLPKCDLATQKKIVSIFKEGNEHNEFSFLFNKISSVEQLFYDNKELSTELLHQQDILKQLRQSFLKEAMQGKLVQQNLKDGNAKDLLEKIKAEKTKLGKKEKLLPEIKAEEIPFDIPENWTWCRFQEITTLITCGLASTPKYYPSGRIFLSAKNVKPFRFIPQEHKFVDEDTYRKITQNAKPELNDILVTRVGAGIGETALIDKEIDFAFYVSLTLIKPIQKFVDSKFLTYFLNSPQGINNALSFTTGKKSSQGNLNVDRVRKFLIPLPALAEQNRIVKKLEELMKLCDDLQASIQASKEQNEMLLQVALRDALKKEEVTIE